MVKCPKCNLEIDENIMQCPMCQTALLEQLKDTGDAALLMTVKDELQANIVESLLSAYDIPLRRQYKGNDSFGKVFMGLTVSGIALYVPKSKLEEAAAIIENEMPEEEKMLEEQELEAAGHEEEMESEEVLAELERKYNDKRRFRAVLILLFFIPGFALLVGAIVYWIVRLFL